MPIKILIADDHELMRQGLVSLLSKEADFEVVGQVATGREAAGHADKLAPDVIVMDISMPDLNGIDATRMVCSRCPGAKIIALSMHKEHRFVVEMMKAGAAGYLPKSSAFEELGQAIRYVYSGQKYLSPSITGPVIQDFLKHVEADGQVKPNVLTGREREVLQLVAEGKSSKEVAASLHVSVNTVIRHRQHIMDKLDIHSVAELTRYAIREGLCGIN